jgi:hypothetical protein
MPTLIGYTLNEKKLQDAIFFLPEKLPETRKKTKKKIPF